jgi:periplasmic protein TonB
MSLRPPFRFTLAHGLAASLALHAAVAGPFVLHRPQAPDEDDDRLVFQLNGVVADAQTDEQTLANPLDAPAQSARDAASAQQAAEQAQRDAEQAQNDGDRPPQQIATAAAERPSPSEPQTTGSVAKTGADEQRAAQTVAPAIDEETLIKAYLKRLTKRVQTKLIYPDAARHAGLKGVATIVFTVQGDGVLREGSLKIGDSSGHASLDASALQALRASAPLPPPPREISLAIGIVFGPKTQTK